MPEIPEELEQRVSKLCADEKACLALYLLELLEPAEDGDINWAWHAEAEARLSAVETGTTQTVSAEDVFFKLDQRRP